MKNNNQEKIYIDVFITKTKKFRAKIKVEGKPPYEVTVGGNNWKQGVGEPFRAIIMKKCRVLTKNLFEDLNVIEFEDNQRLYFERNKLKPTFKKQNLNN